MVTVEYRIYKGELYLDKRKRDKIANAGAQEINLIPGRFVILEIDKMLEPDTRASIYKNTFNLSGATVICTDTTAKELFMKIFAQS